jgi:peptidoglycan hydrolase-like protein with peptidoglycan-binding domain
MLALTAALVPLLAGAGTHRADARAAGPVVSVQQLNEAASTQLPATGAQPVLEGRAGLIQQVQIELSNRGYELGEADGYAGDGTRAAVRHFQRDAGLEIDGKVDADLLAQLQRRAFVGRPFF